MKKKNIFILCLIVVMAMTLQITASAALLTSSTPTADTPWAGQVQSAPNGLNVRSGPGSSYSVLTSLLNGSCVQIVGKSGSWYQLQYSYTGSTGYASTSYLGTNPYYGIVENAPSGLIMRSEPSTTATALLVAPNGSHLPYIGLTEDPITWYGAIWGNTHGWVLGTYYRVHT